MKLKAVCIACVLILYLSVYGIRAEAQVCNVPDNNSFKSFMSYQAITNKASDQYKLQMSCVTNADGVRMYDGRYCIAVGTYYTDKIGVNIDVVLENGTVLECVTGDIKSDEHTDATRRQVPINGNVVEFIVDVPALPQEVQRSGDLSTNPAYEGEIAYLEVQKDAMVMSTFETTDSVYTTFQPDE